MLRYTPPVDDMAFVLFDVFGADAEWARLPAFGNIDRSLAAAVLGEGGKVAADVMAPLNQRADAEGARWENGAVHAPSGFKDAFAALARGGWFGVSGNPAFGGQGLPDVLSLLIEEMFWGANSSLFLYGGLTAGAALCIDAHGDEAAKETYLPPLYSGKWTGAMALTESHAGTDLGMMRTRAAPAGDAYAVTGTKIFITSGEHDLAENIVHLVLAKLPDAPPGSAGISLFLVPKFLADGSRNRFASSAIERKMGIRGSATSVIHYDAATGYLIGKPHQGLACMFTMMNHARLSVGLQGLGLADLAYQNAAAYARERRQGRAAGAPAEPQQEADCILVHGDVRRMLLTQRAWIEGGRAFAVHVGMLLDRAKHEEDPARRARAQRFVDLLTPVAKAFLTDRGIECALLGQQVFGGHGYIVEHGMEQIVRDARIAQIYEGANGIQALDFIGRKVLRDGGRTLRELLAELRGDDIAEEFRQDIADALDGIERTLDALLRDSRADADLPGAVSTDFLALVALGIHAWLWARMATAEGACGGPKHCVARFFYAKLLGGRFALERSIAAGARSVMALPAESF